MHLLQVEAQSHFSLWCMHGSLLLATNDVRKRDKVSRQNFMLKTVYLPRQARDRHEKNF
jgi:hypothetical protein